MIKYWGLRVSICGALLMVLVSVNPIWAVTDPTDQLPDLRMAKLNGLKIEKTGGRRLLHFTATIVNVGVGPFELYGVRPDTDTPEMTVTQRVFDDAGGYRDIPTPAFMYYSGDGHNHWHVRQLEKYELKHLDDTTIRVGEKVGFCFYDHREFNLTLPNAPQTKVYTYATNPPSCANLQPSALDAIMGLSVGWADKYKYTRPDQYVDITGLPKGDYRLKATADWDNLFTEIDDSNNFTWVEIRLTNSGFRILRHGPFASR